MNQQQGQPGWYPDPTGRCEFRFFNGQTWTADVSVDGRRFIDPIGPAVYQPGWGAAPPSASQPSRGFAIASFVIAVVCVVVAWVPFIFALAAVGAVVAFVFGVLGLRNAARHDGLGRGFALSGVLLSVLAAAICVAGFVFTQHVLRAMDDYFHPGKFTTAITKCDTHEGLVTLEGTITNEGTTTRHYTVSLDYLVGNTAMQRDTVDVRTVAPGATASFRSSAIVISNSPVTCAVADVFGPLPFGG